ncbi:MAG: CDP-diacylglycerol--serine O-phosphatidyltransferase [Helicobacteraceae bacterium]|jgi:CDP-diacylglycerol--serine O-phosphatidyltransferase|nr:CDP-diacylglycerol--serine O-phosphatidyltransferase [Helicobacteraceae bacterium]
MEIKNIKIAYLLPNLFTAGSMFLAILAIVSASNGNFEKAFWLVVISSIFDALDGRVARLTNTSSLFGKEFDSLADEVSFGVAPAFIFYFAIGKDFGRFGVLIAAIFAIFGAMRLARFNIISSSTEPNVFIGLPIPAAALSLVCVVLLCEQYAIFPQISLVLGAVIAVLMVSNIRYPSFKQIDFKKPYFLRILIALIVMLAFFYLYPLEILTITTFSYLIAGPARTFWTIYRRKAHSENHKDI